MDDATLEQVEQLREWVSACAPGKMVFLGGAGVSTESGIPDFRSANGLYNQGGAVSPERIISRSYFDAHPHEFFEFYLAHMLVTDALPNAAHRKLAELEGRGTLSAVITQNIDGLHQLAGSVNVLELHGSVHRNACMDCGRAVNDAQQLLAIVSESPDGIPRCSACGGVIKPDVVLYEEPLDSCVLSQAIEAIQAADLMVIAGTSLAVWPAAGLMDYFHGDHLCIVNLQPTPRDRLADLCIQAKVGEVFSRL